MKKEKSRGLLTFAEARSPETSLRIAWVTALQDLTFGEAYPETFTPMPMEGYIGSISQSSTRQIVLQKADDRQIEKFREFVISLAGSGNHSYSSEELKELNSILSYQPEKEDAVPWKEFMFKHYPETLGRDLDLYKVYQEVKKLPE